MAAGKAEKGREDRRVSRAQAQREFRRRAVLDVARRVFSEKGYHKTSIDDLIESAGIARGTFYLYFSSKRAIFDALLDSLLVMLQSTVRRIETGPDAPPPVDQMYAAVDRILDTLLENRETARILLRDAVGIDADFDQKLHDFYGSLLTMIERAIRNGQEMGLVRPCDPTLSAHCVLGSLKETVDWTGVEVTKIIDKPGRKKGIDRERLRGLGRELITFCLQGLFKAA